MYVLPPSSAASALIGACVTMIPGSKRMCAVHVRDRCDERSCHWHGCPVVIVCEAKLNDRLAELHAFSTRIRAAGCIHHCVVWVLVSEVAGVWSICVWDAMTCTFGCVPRLGRNIPETFQEHSPT